MNIRACPRPREQESQPMPGERPEPRLRARGKIKAALKEFVHLIDKIQPEKASTRLQLDMARDAGLDASRKMLTRIHRLERQLVRTRGKRDASRNRLLTLLHELASAPVIFPRPAGLPPIDPGQMERTFDELRAK